MSKTATETRRFGMHPKLLLDVIQRQAGSLAKAILEGVMNSVDAGAKVCRVEIAEDRVVIEDDGKGITKRQEIETFFETFGAPHEDSEGKTYGTFRMGRGQMFAYGKNKWRTGPFQMNVDVKNDGLDYHLNELKVVSPGCRIEIELYDRLYPGDVAETERTIKKWTRYTPKVAVFINGEEVNVDPASEKWDHVTPEAYVRLTDSGSLSVYNLGVHTMDLGNYRFGTGGLIVTKERLKVNFARNDVQSDCEVWKKIKPFVEKKAEEKAVKKKQLNDGQRQRLTDLVVQGNPPPDAKNLKLFTAVNGRHFTAQELNEIMYKYNKKISACNQGSQIGDRLFQQKVAFVLSTETLERFGKSLEKVVDYAWGTLDRYSRSDKPEIVDFKDLAGDLTDDFEIIDVKDWKANEKVWMDLAGRCVGELVGDHREWMKVRRRLVVGTSTGANGWTDGQTYIALDRGFLANLKFDVQGFVELGRLLLHELCHHEPDTASHVHGAEFYEAFHDRCRDHLGAFVNHCLISAPNVLKAASRVSKTALKDVDRAAKIKRALVELVPDRTLVTVTPSEAV
jgi:hypothetical protein